MCWNLDEEKMSRAAAFITDCSRDRRCDERPACAERNDNIVAHIKKITVDYDLRYDYSRTS